MRRSDERILCRSPRGHRRAVLILGLLLVAAAVSACGGDARTKVLDERARWDVELRSWSPSGEDAIALDTQLSGPPNAKIETLTVRFDFLDAAGNVAVRGWHTYDLTQVSRGGPKAVLVRLPVASPAQVEGVRIERMFDPTPEEASGIKELVAASPGS